MRIDRGFAALLATVVIWASTFVVTKAALADLRPLTLTFLRFLVAVGVLVPLAWRQGFRPRMALRPAYLLFGLTGVALFFTLQNVGLAYTTAVSASLIHAGTPAVIAIAAVAVLGERLASRQVVGVSLAVAGSALVALATRSSASGSNPFLGNLLMAGSVLAWTAYTLQGKRLATTADPLVSTAASTLAGLLYLLPLAAWDVAAGGWPRLTVPSLGAVLYLGVAASALTLVLWNYALSLVKASVASAFINLVPIVGTGLALLTGEALSPLELAGGVLALAGVWLSTQAARPSQIPAEA
ncbi:MAG: DMT family transporter [Chloroflexi bacterium]|nr:DMT family transporter [Chloroflexota bacterium]